MCVVFMDTMGRYYKVSFQQGHKHYFLSHKLFSVLGVLRPILNFCPLGVKLSPWGESLSLPLHSSKQKRVFTPGGERRGEHYP
jgi:hypothetical protein